MLNIESFIVIIQVAVLAGLLGILLVLEHLRAQGVKREQMAEEVAHEKEKARRHAEKEEWDRAHRQRQKEERRIREEAIRGDDEKAA